MVSISGLRGVVGESLTPEVVIKYANAFSVFSGREKIVVGGEGRYHGAMLSEILAGALAANGCDVVDFGICPTPTVQLAAEHSEAVGEINVFKKMKEVNAVVGGEGSGGITLPEVQYGRDALVGIGITLQHLLEFGGTLSELKKSLPNIEIVKKRIDLSRKNPERIISAIKKHYSRLKIDTDDRLKIDAPDYWVHIRKSNTEPIIRVIAEAATRVEAESRANEVAKLSEKL